MTLKTGDVLKDNDPRTNGATVEVIAVGDTHAICKRGPRRVEIALTRIFNDGKSRRTGFTVMPLTPKEG